ncbi:COMM domain-containing protein 1 [Ixodes scapularis]|uniref:COMM domain-containing protein 1 n=1 Tax=Ixodes scapularis TaxID=6945 RepID=UPI001A9D70B5|nr:COMM domain-containing protein 1 [Ixodes scapularis]
MAEDPFFGLLNGIAQKLYYENKEITDDVLKNDLYPSVTDQEFSKLLAKATNVIKTLAASNMDWTQLEAFLTSQTKRQEGGLTAEQAQSTARFWQGHRSRIRASVLAQSRWDPGLESCSWRVDVDGPTAHVTLGQAQLQLDKSHLEALLQSIADVQVALDKHCPKVK